ncbi:bifunctional diaminohydroxyphosphoribosylaminopyrimidine deaminase/5-amino-6-(5-phosphoribosylamino)uracil reductase RibD [Brevibacillus composti]|uniref:Riboflavin biosynthesis protein RibD n=1 Tax=Brevibacillus composti TaxID=2796470 RepID=A0A7T5EMH9_9BACL|nr:bifunctional diaminohydroxyphosphoribosylaminopyrimidine deaminase/5-amino-6-(5-phosphoribosylamino)uracil reductase RibD [Brevibacillus composti]QQE75261.1 bifunctional diaminohydroxyphosphoribosylaminopyrimidine deaminase/5-amino-6-(5-phosphoribosylamino)uracil reductase RibD [Brevibacillus composti]QUO42288.1 bifunctional diaminohydroxyphosphoribosylaminopyrimidine deaminase/5-amino-6-(5-phosphoribosylamino)uracil reductase RibD [Brevibacillus composti]
MSEHDWQHMALALELARSAKGQTAPNPLVGAVVVKDGMVVGLGTHVKAGEPHAEVHALRMAGEHAKGADLYVTLEPCSHQGRTPPCARAVIEAGIRRVVVAVEDPNPRVAGAGIRLLQEAGLEVSVGICAAQAKRLNEVFFHYIGTKKPFVTVKTASTLDGKIATRTGHSRWITGEESRKRVHRLRREHDAILVGVQTVLADNPELTAREDGEVRGRQPLRVILDSRLRIPADARVICDGHAPTLIYTSDKAPSARQQELEQRGVEVVRLPDGVGIERVLESLGQRGVTSLLVEGGSAVNGSFLEAGAIQKVIQFFSFKLIGGQGAPTSYGGQGFAEMQDAIPLADVEVEMIGSHDLCITGYPVWGQPAGRDLTCLPD